MNSEDSKISTRRMRRPLAAAIALSTAVVVFAPATQAQTATISGSLGNFDVVNNTGQDTCGFEVELEGIPVDTLLYTFSANRFGAPAIAPYSTGTVSGLRVTWKSNNCSTNKTIPHQPGTAFAGTCYQWYPATYDAAGCEHFGVGYNAPTTRVTSRWLVVDVNNPGSYVPRDPPMPVGFPTYYVAPPVVANAAPVIVAEIQAPEPAEAPSLYGPAQWVRVFRQQLPRAVTLEELVTDNPLVVPLAAGQLEANWSVIQTEPASGTNGKRQRKQGSSTLDPSTRTVVRRYEFYEYTGAYDPITNEALCADTLCNTPATTELGDFISAQMTAVAVQGDFLTITKSGSGGGNVDSSDKVLSCGSKCTSPYNAGTAVSLTAKANSGSAFIGWTGACTGTGSCTIAVNGAQSVGARFDTTTTTATGGGSGGGGGGGASTSYTLKASVSNSGTVTSNVGGINCGVACSANYTPGTVVTVTATPPAGKSFSGWSGACTGTNPTCDLTMSANLSVKATFSK
jgi:hypothetical protein